MPTPLPFLVNAAEMGALEAAAVAAGTTESALMDEAGAGLARTAAQFCPAPGTAILFTGKGHNGGDAFVLAAHLLHAGWDVECRSAWPEETWRPLTREKYAAVRDRLRFAPPDAPVDSLRPLLLVDGLLGTGSNGKLQAPVRAACCALNALRAGRPAITMAIDLPSGLHPDTGEADPDTVTADLTAMPGFPKTGPSRSGAARFTGRLVHLPLPGLPLPANTAARDQLITPATLRHLLPPRPFPLHKGEAGRIGIVAGSRGLTGAARLAASAAAAAGGGLVTLFCPHDVFAILAAACPPEVMVRPVNSCLEIMDFPLDAIGTGPGMGPAPLPCLASLLRDDPRPVLIDADALNIMASCRVSLAARSGGPRLLTPHPGELARLARAFAPDDPEPAAALAASQHAVVLSKSARSAILETGRPSRWNTTGHPSMARGGMGDVLTGIVTAFAAQGMPFPDAAALGSWLLGAAAEIHQRTFSGAPEEFSATRLIDALGPALALLRQPDSL